ncbi:MAG TPA: UDP-2,4-diacetamido-2,4,6-trideoxy-beta-L-altropyranose hydrolase [Sulfurimonas sp.]|nr:UDP-2,4-diacetamido-2,4,6-trideoxy-beta-L-altropyranose hydrolase [Sulfurimonas sp.]
MRKILFRADSSSLIGTGHIMRDLVLAEEFSNAKIFFAVQDLEGNINSKIKEKNHSIKILHSNDCDELISLIKSEKIDMVVIDHYRINEAFERRLKEETRVEIFVLDDTYEKHYCDILLNHNIYAEVSKYEGLVSKECEIRCGKNFTLLRDEFKTQKQLKVVNLGSSTTIFLAMGGTDHLNLNIKILNVLNSFTNLKINVVTTTANQNLPELETYVKNKENIALHINTNEISYLMNNADLAVVSPSVTLNEIVYLDIPFVAIKTAENQMKMYEYLVKNNFNSLASFNADLLANMIEESLSSIKTELINFTDLSLDENELVLSWRNNGSIRKWMYNTNIINLKDHLNYIDSLHTKKDRLYFLVKQNNKPIGVIDFTNITKDKAEFGVYSNPTVRKVGNTLMHEIINYAFNTLRLHSLVAGVFKDNTTALNLYKRYLFTQEKIELINNKELIYLELRNNSQLKGAAQ